MSADEAMKLRLALAMRDCIGTTAVENITVKQICEESGTSRQTFYRHFLDKYDLINWYFDRLLTESFERMGQGQTVYDGLVRKFTYISDERAFFTAAFRSDEQNNLRDHDFHMIYHFYLQRIALWQNYEFDRQNRPSVAVDTWTGRAAAEDGLRSVSADEDAVDEETRELFEMYCCASIYMTVKWVLSGMRKSPAELARLMIAAMPGRIVRIFTAVGLLE
ncbi:MAG: TetR family transcriptional regulator [Chordicoccus sp.]